MRPFRFATISHKNGRPPVLKRSETLILYEATERNGRIQKGPQIFFASFYLYFLLYSPFIPSSFVIYYDIPSTLRYPSSSFSTIVWFSFPLVLFHIIIKGLAALCICSFFSLPLPYSGYTRLFTSP
ncbi:hypothetical protein HOY82DRAFT_126837 [Tuber indicum]|nr:hypothetical protein HOY82DRAFT_126837 [Tuber indicum]